MPITPVPHDFEYMNHKKGSSGKPIWEDRRCRAELSERHLHPDEGPIGEGRQCALALGHLGRHEYHVYRDRGLLASWADKPE